MIGHRYTIRIDHAVVSVDRHAQPLIRVYYPGLIFRPDGHHAKSVGTNGNLAHSSSISEFNI